MIAHAIDVHAAVSAACIALSPLLAMCVALGVESLLHPSPYLEREELFRD